MTDILADERLVWFVMRGSGIVLLVLFTAAVVLGTVSSHGGASRPGARVDPDAVRVRGVSRFALTRVHRDVSLICLALLALHALSAAYHGFVDIGWVDVAVPFVSSYERLWIGLGTAALDLLVAASLAAALRERLGRRAWRAVHATTYLAWVLAVAHTLGIGTDRSQTWAVVVGVCCAVAFAVAVVWRLTWRREPAPLVRHGALR